MRLPTHSRCNQSYPPRSGSLAGDDLDSVINHFKAVKKADNRYKSFGGIKKNAKGSVKFVIETDPIEADEN